MTTFTVVVHFKEEDIASTYPTASLHTTSHSQTFTSNINSTQPPPFPSPIKPLTDRTTTTLLTSAHPIPPLSSLLSPPLPHTTHHTTPHRSNPVYCASVSSLASAAPYPSILALTHTLGLLAGIYTTPSLTHTYAECIVAPWRMRMCITGSSQGGLEWLGFHRSMHSACSEVLGSSTTRHHASQLHELGTSPYRTTCTTSTGPTAGKTGKPSTAKTPTPTPPTRRIAEMGDGDETS